MSQTRNPLALALTGQLPFILGAAGLLAFPISFLLLRLYRRAVLKSMDRQVGDAEGLPGAKEADAPSTPQPAAPLQIITLQETDAIPLPPEALGFHDRAVHAPWRAAAVYSLGGAIFTAIMTMAILVSGKLHISPIRFLLVSWTYGWPILLSLGLIAGSRARTKLVLALAYFGGYVLLGGIALALSPKLSAMQLFTLWWTTNLIATVLVLAYLAHQVRAVGPMVLTFLVIAITGSQVIVGLVGSSESLMRRLVDYEFTLGLGFFGGTGLFWGLHVIGFAAFGVLGWLLVQWIRAGYERKKISDQSLTLDSLWLLFGIVYSIELVFEGPGWIAAGLVAFLAYKIAVKVGFSLFESSVTRQGIRLLLLRVFALGKRSEKLFDAFGAHWRYIGPIQMIAGPDLATTTIAPHEFLQFLAGKLARRFIGDRKTLALRFAEMDLKPDRDWRYRVNDYFCFADTWKMVLNRLVSESDAVLMDLRSFSPERAGCIFEISELINSVSLDRTVFIVDATTDEPFLRQTIRQAWNDLRPSSPNYTSLSPRLLLLHYAGSKSQDQLLRAVCAATRPVSAPAHKNLGANNQETSQSGK
jgi:hypothetical protein